MSHIANLWALMVSHHSFPRSRVFGSVHLHYPCYFVSLNTDSITRTLLGQATSSPHVSVSLSGFPDTTILSLLSRGSLVFGMTTMCPSGSSYTRSWTRGHLVRGYTRVSTLPWTFCAMLVLRVVLHLSFIHTSFSYHSVLS